ncbi:MAG: hypothetical protein ABW124_10480, partial [Candidatus Thiodiazotropha sp. 6PLUC9]
LVRQGRTLRLIMLLVEHGPSLNKIAKIEQQGSLDEAKRNPGSLVHCSPGFRCTSSRLRVAVFYEEGDSPERLN